MTKYKTGRAYNDIKEVEVLRETDKSVWVGKFQYSKHCANINYWDTWGKAHSYLTGVVQRKIDNLQRQLVAEEKKLAEIAGMKEEIKCQD